MHNICNTLNTGFKVQCAWKSTGKLLQSAVAGPCPTPYVFLNKDKESTFILQSIAFPF